MKKKNLANPAIIDKSDKRIQKVLDGLYEIALDPDKFNPKSIKYRAEASYYLLNIFGYKVNAKKIPNSNDDNSEKKVTKTITLDLFNTCD